MKLVEDKFPQFVFTEHPLVAHLAIVAFIINNVPRYYYTFGLN